MKKCKTCGSTECKTCAICNQNECQHHTFIPVNRPETCICDANEWRTPQSIPDVCDNYVGDGTQNCRNCEHDKDCHQQKNIAPTSQPQNPICKPIKQTKKCTCDTSEWRNPQNIPAVCDNYVGDGTQNCINCEHDKNCHQQ